MNNPDIVIELYKYFAQFVSAEVIEKTFTSPKNVGDGYNEVVAEVLARSPERVIASITTYVCSASAKFVADAVRNSKEMVLFVEYGNSTVEIETDNGLQQQIAITVALPYNTSNSDNLREALQMNQCYNTLVTILDFLHQDNENGVFPCGLVEFPANVVPIDPIAFFERAGFTAFINVAKTIY